MKHHEVVAAIIQQGQQILCLQRGPSKYEYISLKWEFPGGKVESGETQQQALVREIQEELGMDVRVEAALLTVEHEYPDFSITMHGYVCAPLTTEVMLHEHTAYQWLYPSQLGTLDWAAADLPFVAALTSH